MKHVIILGVSIIGSLLILVMGGRKPPGLEMVKAPPGEMDPVQNHSLLEGRAVKLELSEYLPAVGFASSQEHLFLLSRTSTSAALHRFDLHGRNPLTYDQSGFGPGELDRVTYINMFPNEVMVTESQRSIAHVFDMDLNYKEVLNLPQPGRVVMRTETWTALWGGRKASAKDPYVTMLNIYDHDLERTVAHLVPASRQLFGLGMQGDAVKHGDRIYAVSARTASLDMIDTTTWETKRLELADGIRNMEPKPYEGRTSGGGRYDDFLIWLGSFTRVTDLAIVKDLLVILYARGEQCFFDVHHLDGSLFSKNHRTNLLLAGISGTRLEGLQDLEDGGQAFVSIDLVEVVGKLKATGGAW